MPDLDQSYARVVADSVSPRGDRLTTMEVRFHRFVLAEWNTHRAFSRSSASSRAIPVEKQLDRLVANAAWPLEWPGEQPGMQGGKFLEGDDLHDAEELFIKAHAAVTGLVASYLERHPDKSTRLHKSLINRLLEPFMWHTVICSSTTAGWDNFFAQRCSPLAQPEIRVAAEMVQSAMAVSSPRNVRYGEWHTPYIQPDEDFDVETRIKVSVARCARVSYLNHDGVRDVEADLGLFEKLVTADPPHWAPLEMVASPAHAGRTLGNFDGWHQLRHRWGLV